MLTDWLLYRKSYNELLQELQERIIKEQRTFIVTANPAIVMQGKKDSTYRKIILNADYITPDGIGVVMACKWLGTPVAERITGFDLMESLLQLADQFQWKVYLLGAKPGVVSLTKENIQQKYQGIEIVGFHHGYFDLDEEIVEGIQRTEPDLIFVGMGCPRQERLIFENMKQFRKGLYIGVGGSFDVLSGMDKRAPKGWINLYLEWFYRIIRKPRRVYILKDLFLFLGHFLQEWIRLRYKKLKAAEKWDGSK